MVKTIAKKKGGAAALRAQNSAANAASQPDGNSEPHTPRRGRGDVWVEVPSRSSPPSAPVQDDDRAISPISTASSASEPPLAQKVRGINGAHHVNSVPSSNEAQALGESNDATFASAEPSVPASPPRTSQVSCS
jgi:SWI/SNF-related matrix-associated actin-dependent regulator of chromatin subfamily B member 1